MKSGLRDRNNMDYLKEIQSTYKPVSMKSGLRDRNNELPTLKITRTLTSQ